MTLLVHLLQYRLRLSDIMVNNDTDYRSDYQCITTGNDVIRSLTFGI